MTAQSFASLLTSAIINPVLFLLFGAAVIIFIWGVIQFIAGLATGKGEKSEGKKHMLWGLIGLFVMLTATSLIGLVVNTFAPGCWPPQGTSCGQYYQVPANGGF